MLQTLDEIREDAISRLVVAPRDRNSALHTPLVVTSDADARIMVLRAFDTSNWTMRFHTDVRAPKVNVIESLPRMAVVGYDREAKLQLRMRGTGRVVTRGPQIDAAWEESTNFAKRCYLGAGPGEESKLPTSGLPAEVEGIEPTDEELIPARENFAVLFVDVDSIDWYSLSSNGHRRALIGRADASWLTP